MTKLIFFIFFTSFVIHSQVINYNWPSTIPQSDKYIVKVISNGVVEDVFTHICLPRTEEGPDGLGINNELIDRTFSFVEFSFDGGVILEVTKLFGENASRVEISPAGYGINPFYFDGKTVRFELDRWRYVSVNFVSPDNIDAYDVKHSLMIFADSLESYDAFSFGGNVVQYSPSADLISADVIYFPPGDYDLTEKYQNGRLPITKTGQKIYLAGGAFVRGSIDGNRRSNTWLYGRGVISGRDFTWHQLGKIPFIDFMGADFVHVEGISIVQSFHHTIPSGNNSYIKNLKIFGWCWNNDGIRPSTNSYVDGIFIKTMDDYDYVRDKHTVVNSVFWPMRNGAVGQIGWNNLGSGNTTYRDNYYILGEWESYARRRGVVGSMMNQGTNISNNHFENLYLEDNQMQLCNVTMEWDNSADPVSPSNLGTISNFTFKNIKVEKDNFYTNSGNVVKNRIAGFSKDGGTAVVKDFKFINLVVGNKIVTNENHTDYFDIDLATTSNIQFLTEGEFYNLSTSSIGNGSLVPSGDIPIPAGMNQSIKIIPDNGYKISKIIVNGEEIQRQQHLLFENVNEDHELSVEFESGDDFYNLDFDKSYGINIDFINPSGNNFISQDSLLTVSISSKSLYSQINKVELFLNDSLTSLDDSEPYSFEISNLSIGKHQLKAIAYDLEGNKSQKSIDIEVFIPDTEAPKISFLKPMNGNDYFYGDSVDVSIETSDNIKIISKTIYLDGILIFEQGEINSDSLVVTRRIGDLESGVHSVRVEAIDQAQIVKIDSLSFNVLEIIPQNYFEANFHFENNIADSSGNNYDGEFIDQPSFNYARAGSSISFDGLNDAVDIPQIIKDHFTFSFHIKLNTIQSTSEVGIFDASVDGENDDFSIRLINSKMSVVISNPKTIINTDKNITDNNWHHVFIVRHGDTGKIDIYIDDILEISKPASPGIKNNSQKIRIGGLLNGTGFLKGELDDVHVYSAPLTQEASKILSGKIQPWSAKDIGNSFTKGFSKNLNNSYYISSTDTGLSGTKDQLHYIYQLINDQTNLVAKIEDINSTSILATSGLMMRQSLNESGAYVSIMFRKNSNEIIFMSRTDKDTPSKFNSVPNYSNTEYWLRLERLGDKFYGYVSNNSNDWTLIGSVAVPMSSYIYSGLAVSSGDSLINSVTKFSNISFVDKPVGIEMAENSIPTQYKLYQNYPNPFNPSTQIEFGLPQPSQVSLKIYDILGRIVVELVNENLIAGNYTVYWNASNNVSGIYIYKLETENFSSAKKMILIK